MKTMILAAALAAVVAGPALAASHQTPHHLRHDRQTGASALVPDPIGVYVDGREIGRDPDPAIRAEIQRDYYTQQGD